MNKEMVWSPAQRYIQMSKYSRWNDELGRRETWPETTERYVGFFNKKFGDKVPTRVWAKIRDHVLNMKSLGSMRALWTAGDCLAENNITGFNCSFLPIIDIRALVELFYILMCGTGVGFSVENHYIAKLPIVNKQTGNGRGTHRVGDSREGWADSLAAGLEAWFAGDDIDFDFAGVRKKGSRLKKMGGRASGPEPLVEMLRTIRQVVLAAQGRRLTDLEIQDICNLIADVVVVGGIRRASEISFSDIFSSSIRDAKTGNYPVFRRNSNNSTVYFVRPSMVDFMGEWAALAKSGTGERGIYNLTAVEKRIPKRRTFTTELRTNPCQPAGSLHLTPSGIRTMGDIQIGDTIWSGERWTKVVNKVATGVKPVFAYRTRAGQFIGTENHRVVSNGVKVEASKANSIDSSVGPYVETVSFDSRDVWDGLIWEELGGKIPDRFLYGTPSKVVGFLRGLYWAKGSVVSDGVILRDTRRDVIDAVQVMLSSVGISSYYTKCKRSYVLNITTDRTKFSSLIGFVLQREQKRLVSACRRPHRSSRKINYDIREVEPLRSEPVFDITVEDAEHTYWTGGVKVSNCGEAILRPFEMCNLSEVVVRAGDEFDDLVQKVEVAVWLGAMQSCLTDFPYIRPEFKKNCEEERLLGISLTGQMDNPKLLTDDRVSDLKKYALKVCRRACNALGINMSAAITCGKPSGCRPWYALTTTSKGLLTLEELFADHPEDQVWANMQVQNNVLHPTPHKILKTYNNGESELREVQLSYGMVLHCTPNHQWEVKKKGWVKTEDLIAGDEIEMVPGIYTSMSHSSLPKLDSQALKMSNDADQISQPELMSPQLAWLLGYLWGNGAQSPSKYRVRFIDQRLDVITKAQQVFKEIFGIDANLYRASGHRNAYTLDVSSKMLWHWLIKNNVWKYFSDQLDTIPRCVRESSTEDIIAFMAGMLDSDGWVGQKNNKPSFAFTTTHESFSQHLQHVGWSVGVCVGRSLNSIGKNLQKSKRTFSMNNAGAYTTEKALELLARHSVKMSSSGLNWGCDSERVNNCGVVTQVIPLPPTRTYDIEVDQEHWYFNGAVKSHNTLSQLVDSASGMHARFAKRYIRRFRENGTSPVYQMLKSQGVNFFPEVGQENKPEDQVTTWVFEVPVSAPKGSVIRDQMTAIQQLEWYLKMQKNWCEGNQSCTIYVRDDEWLKVGAWVYDHWDDVVGVAFLPFDGGKYKLAPYEEITDEEYERRLKEFPVIDWSQLGRFEVDDTTSGASTAGCTSDRCELP